MKRTLSLILSLVLFCSIFSCLSVTVNAASASDLKFTLSSDGKSYYLGLQATSLSGALNIPSTYNGKPVTSIADSAFIDCVNLTSVTIPNSVTSIGEKAFWGCSKLSSITIPDSVTSIGGWAFSGTAYYYNSSKWQNYVLYIGNHIIKAKDSLSGSYVIKNGTKTIAGAAFYSCTALTSINIPDSVTSIGASAFCDCIRLTDIYYSGTKTQRENISIAWNNDCLNNAEWHFCNNVHTEVKDAAIAPTCTTPGKTEGSHCSVCDKVIVAQITVSATGHTASDWIVDTTASYTNSGSKYTECMVCGEILQTAVIPQLAPLTPTPKAINTLNGIQVTWNIVAGATKYVVYRRNAGSGTWTAIGTTTSSSLVDKNVTAGKYYIYSIRAYNAQGSYSAYVSTKTKTIQYILTPTADVTNLANGVQVTWNSVAGATKYNVYRRNAGSSSWVLVGTTTRTSLVDKGVTNGKYYVYSIRAINGTGYSAFDTSKTDTIQPVTAPTAKVAKKSNGVQVSWNSVSGATKYNVYRRLGGTSTWIYVGTTTSTTLLDKGVVKGKSYAYSIRAINGTGYSAYNNTKCAAIKYT